MYDANEESEEEGGEGYGEEELRVAEGLDVPVVIAKVRSVIFHYCLLIYSADNEFSN